MFEKTSRSQTHTSHQTIHRNLLSYQSSETTFGRASLYEMSKKVKTNGSSGGAVGHYYRKTEPFHSLLPSVKEELKDLGKADEAKKITAIETESCFNVMASSELSKDETEKLEWLLRETFEHDALANEKSFLEQTGDDFLVEFGPRMTFTSAFSSNAVSICQACQLPVSRLELSRRYKFVVSSALSDEAVGIIKGMLHDRMTEEEYAKPLETFETGIEPKKVRIIPIMKEGRAALEKLNDEMGLGFDDFDLDYYTNLFKVCKQWSQGYTLQEQAWI